MQLSEQFHFFGLIGIIGTSMTIFFAILVLIKAIKSRDRLVLNFFFVIIFTISPWTPKTINFIFWLITGDMLNDEILILAFLEFQLPYWLG